MSDALDEEEPFDWSVVNAGIRDPQTALEHLLHYLEHQLRSNRPEEETWQELVAAGILPEDVGALLRMARANLDAVPQPDFILRSGPMDYGRVFDNLHQQEVERRGRRSERRERRKKSARLAAAVPEDRFDFGEGSSLAETLTRETGRKERGSWVATTITVVVVLPFLVGISACVISGVLSLLRD